LAPVSSTAFAVGHIAAGMPGRGHFGMNRNSHKITQESIMETCYPELGKAVATEWEDSGLGYSAKGPDQIWQAVELERTRLWEDQPAAKEAETALGREIQKQTGVASVLVNRIVRDVASKRLKSNEGEGSKPN
jgi:hypothetical protein